ncbi:hypothetical protein [Pseudobacteriovorax antillogorgiicola]|uniref:Lipoprotein n=1 Tax=Pseudobacteriovorax antillogorgiicola TaxID=1513793 RepID=A0A1Y6BN53_9BACT|nr:hypothetical protein [Pseudobacteriovorax antillogorgiicola]TCS55443.1 hypothetical protein EDD56_105164 [Pseudobacteriovorax antillogorgiicola]SMF12398.1 hypothetical protein SAMN06296036_105160 [Pseudobacteriovorax antillogorgiicola]
MKKGIIIPALVSMMGLVSCGDSSDDSSGDSASTRTTTGTVEASTVSDLGLTGALSLDLPDALEDTSSSLRLQGSKSMEACLMRASAKQLITQIQMAASTLCHVEAEGSTIPWNTAVILDFSSLEAAALTKRAALQGDTPPDLGDLPEGGEIGEEGAPTGAGGDDFSMPMLGIYTDDTDGDNVSIYICEGEDESSMTLVQSFTITGSKTVTNAAGESVKASKGTMHMGMSDDTFGTFKGAIAYDNNFTVTDTNSMSMEVKFEFDGFSFAQKFGFDENSSISTVSISETGTMDFGDGDPFTFKNAGIGAFDADNGHVFYSYEGFGDTFATRACVDSESYLVDCTDTKLQSGGALYLTTDDVPTVLTSSFTPAEPSGFDCSAQTWTTVTPATDDATIAAHEACDEDLISSISEDDSMSACFTGYAQSDEPATIVFEEEESSGPAVEVEAPTAE